MAWINRKIRVWIGPLLLLLSATHSYGQDTLPDFTALIRSGKRVQINWINPYGERTRQLSVQRSRDRQRLFKTIASITDPAAPRNGYLDQQFADTSYYYRLYILLDSGRYVFSTPRKAVKFVAAANPAAEKKPVSTPTAGIKPPRPTSDSVKEKPAPELPKEVVIVEKAKPPVRVPAPEKQYTIKKGDSLYGKIREGYLRKFRDSILINTKDTIAAILKDTIFIKPFIVKDIYKLSKYVFMDKSGVLHIALPDASKKKYLVRFYEEDKTLLFDIKNIRDYLLLLDKSNFQHAGWFLFEVFESDNLVEKNKVYISKDF
jgi:hypothetical protein